MKFIENLTKKAVKDGIKTVKAEAVSAIDDIHGEILEAKEDLLPFVITGGLLLIAVLCAKKPQPITVHVTIKSK